MIIRLEQEKDYLEVENLTREAFWNLYRPGYFVEEEELEVFDRAFPPKVKEIRPGQL